jgi:hypothetical protein
MWWKRIALLVATGLAAASVFAAESADFNVVLNWFEELKRLAPTE